MNSNDRRQIAAILLAAAEVLAAKTTLYRGTGKNTGKAVWGPGRYYTDNKTLAEKYGTVEEYEIDVSKTWDGDADFTSLMLKKLSTFVEDPSLADSLTWGNKDYQVLARNLAAVMAEKEGGRDREFYDKAKALLSSFLKFP